MNLNILESHAVKYAEVEADEIVITTAQEALDLMATAMYQDASALILSAKHLAPAFFDLKTGLAGDILQKFSNYGMQLMIVGDFSTIESESLKAFIAESNRGHQVAFVNTREAALDKIKPL